MRGVGRCSPTNTTGINTSNTPNAWTRETGSSRVTYVRGNQAPQFLPLCSHVHLHFFMPYYQRKKTAKYALISIMVDCLSRLIIVITINIGFQVVREEGPPEDPHSPCPREAPPPQVRGVRQELQSELQSQQTHEGNHYSNTDIRKTLFQYSSSLYKPLDAESLYSNSDIYGVFFI